MSNIDEKIGKEVLEELILEDGRVVYELLWCSGGPCAGAGSESVIRFAYFYWPHSSYDGLSGPYVRLEEALSSALTAVTDATISVRSSELSSEQIVEYLEPIDLEGPKRIVINGEEWIVTPEGRFMKKSIPADRSGKLIKLFE